MKASEMPKVALVEGEEIAAAIMKVIERTCNKHARKGDTIYINSIISALISCLAHYLAGIDFDRLPEAYSEVGTQLAAQVTRNRKLGAHARVETEPEEPTLQ